MKKVFALLFLVFSTTNCTVVRPHDDDEPPRAVVIVSQF